MLTALKSNPEAFAQSHNMLLIDRILAQHIVLEGGNVASRNIRNGQILVRARAAGGVACARAPLVAGACDGWGAPRGAGN